MKKSVRVRRHVAAGSWMVKPEVVNDENMAFIAHDIARKIESEMEYPGQIKVHVIRESRAVEYAK